MKNIFIVLFILLLASIGLNWYLLTRPEQEPDVKIEKVIKYDTIKVDNPVLLSKTVIKTKLDTLVMKEVIPGDTVRVAVEIPYEQKLFQEDSLYRAYVSGVDPNLDSIRIFYKTVEIKEIREHYIKDSKRLGIGPVVYTGYSPNSKKLDWGVGIGVTYQIFKW